MNAPEYIAIFVVAKVAATCDRFTKKAR